jgi:ATP-dependent RNA helicase DDX24/MAK5
LVIDEADRMVSQGSFKELGRILDAVQAANPMDEDDDEEDDADGDDEDADGDEAERMFGLPGVPGEAKVQMLSDDVMKQLEQQRGDGDDDDDANGSDTEEPPTKEMEDDEFEALANEQKGEDEDDSDADFSLPALPPVERQTFVYSATLTLPSPTPFTKSKGKKRPGVDIDGAIAEILEKARAKGKTKIVDLTNAEKAGKLISVAGAGSKESDKNIIAPVRQIKLPPGLELQAIKCTQLHKDSHLYAYLMTTTQGISGPCLVFCNSIAAVRRVGTTLETLGLPVRILHAQMQQVRTYMSMSSDSQSPVPTFCDEEENR